MQGVLRLAHTGHLPDPLNEARRVLRAEAHALEVLAQSLGDAFNSAVSVIEASKGRVVCTGMGKSGLVCRKIAATLASTGTPALFVHPGEASHGDLGMIIPGDVILAVSASGETSELTDMLYYGRRTNIPIVAITRSAESRLGSVASIRLLLPHLPEACPLNLAPMTSTTATIALGDALAAALMLRRGFNAAEFRTFHPGGRLGAQLLTVTEIMHTGKALPLVNVCVSMHEAVLEVNAKGFGCVGIVDDTGRLIGIFTDGDLRRRFGSALPTDRAAKFMTSNPQRVPRDTLAVDAASLMEQRGVPSLFVVDHDGRPVGLVHLHDLLRARLV